MNEHHDAVEARISDALSAYAESFEPARGDTAFDDAAHGTTGRKTMPAVAAVAALVVALLVGALALDSPRSEVDELRVGGPVAAQSLPQWDGIVAILPDGQIAEIVEPVGAGATGIGRVWLGPDPDLQPVPGDPDRDGLAPVALAPAADGSVYIELSAVGAPTACVPGRESRVAHLVPPDDGTTAEPAVGYPSARAPAVSPDGRFLALLSDRCSEPALIVIDLDGGWPDRRVSLRDAAGLDDDVDPLPWIDWMSDDGGQPLAAVHLTSDLDDPRDVTTVALDPDDGRTERVDGVPPLGPLHTTVAGREGWLSASSSGSAATIDLRTRDGGRTEVFRIEDAAAEASVDVTALALTPGAYRLIVSASIERPCPAGGERCATRTTFVSGEPMPVEGNSLVDLGIDTIAVAWLLRRPGASTGSSPERVAQEPAPEPGGDAVLGGGIVAVLGDGAVVELTATGEIGRELRPPDPDATGAFVDDGVAPRWVSVGPDGSVYLGLEPTSEVAKSCPTVPHQSVVRLRGDGAIEPVADLSTRPVVSPDGRWLAVGSDRCGSGVSRVGILDLGTGKEVDSFGATGPVEVAVGGWIDGRMHPFMIDADVHSVPPRPRVASIEALPLTSGGESPEILDASDPRSAMPSHAVPIGGGRWFGVARHADPRLAPATAVSFTVWSATEAVEVARLGEELPPGGDHVAVSLAPRGDEVLIALADGGLFLWRIDGGAPHRLSDLDVRSASRWG